MRIVRTAARLSASTSSGRPTGGAGGVSANGPEELARRVRAAGVRDEPVLEAVASVPRAGFVPREYRERAYRDEPIPIGHGR
jgi:hypothetical protein